MEKVQKTKLKTGRRKEIKTWAEIAEMANSKIRKSVKTNREVYNRLIRKKEKKTTKIGNCSNDITSHFTEVKGIIIG